MKKENAALKKRIRALEKALEKARAAMPFNSSECLSNFLELIPLASIILNPDGELIYFNDKFTELTGYAREDVVPSSRWFMSAYADPEYRERIIRAWREAKSPPEGTALREYLLIRCKDSLLKNILFTVWKLENGNIFVILEDVTPIKKAEEKLIDSENRFMELVELLPQFIFECDLSGRFIYSNGKSLEVFGYDESDLARGINISDIVVPEDLPRAMKNIPGVLKGGPPLGETYTAITRNGKKIPVRIYAGPLYRNDQLAGIIGAAFDISDIISVQNDLKESEGKFRILAENSMSGIALYQEKGIIYVNPALCAMSGFTEEELLKTNFIDLIHPDSRERVISNSMKRMKGEATESRYEIQAVKKDGSPFWMDMTIAVIDFMGERTFIGTALDITERMRMEEDLKESEEKFRILAENSLSAIFMHQDANLIYVNPALCAMTGFSREEMLNNNFLQYIHKDSMDLVLNMARQRGAGDDSVSRYEVKAMKKDGSWFWLDIATAMINYMGRKTILASAFDITERKKFEELLRSEMELNKKLIDTAQVLILTLDREGNIVSFNAYTEILCGYRLDELKGKNWFDTFLLPEELEKVKDIFFKVVNGGPYTKGAMNSIRTKNGLVKQVDWYDSRLLDDRGDTIGVLAIGHDVTEKLKFEKEMQKIQKLESLGLLAGGIAHDFNNIMTAILGNISILKIEEDSVSTERYKLLDEAEKATIRATDLTRQLLTFARGGVPIKQTLSIVGLIKESSEFILRGTKIKFVMQCDDGIRDVDIDRGQMNQVIQNLIINSVQAMPDGGIIEVRVTNYKAIPSDAGLNFSDYVKISISDNGIGIPREDIGKIFDPYFTTKDKGSGLGLPVVYSVINKHDGAVTVESELGKGTVFTLFIPSHGNARGADDTRKDDIRKGSGRILIMDDDDSVRAVAGSMIRHLGYEPCFSKNGEEAIIAYGESLKSGSRFDVVLLDLTIPGGMGGKDAVKRILDMDSGARVVVCSGYSNDAVIANYRDYGFRSYLLKPYRLEELSRVIKENLT